MSFDLSTIFTRAQLCATNISLIINIIYTHNNNNNNNTEFLMRVEKPRNDTMTLCDALMSCGGSVCYVEWGSIAATTRKNITMCILYAQTVKCTLRCVCVCGMSGVCCLNSACWLSKWVAEARTFATECDYFNRVRSTVHTIYTQLKCVHIFKPKSGKVAFAFGWKMQMRAVVVVQMETVEWRAFYVVYILCVLLHYTYISVLYMLTYNVERMLPRILHVARNCTAACALGLLLLPLLPGFVMMVLLDAYAVVLLCCCPLQHSIGRHIITQKHQSRRYEEKSVYYIHNTCCCVPPHTFRVFGPHLLPVHTQRHIHHHVHTWNSARRAQTSTHNITSSRRSTHSLRCANNMTINTHTCTQTALTTARYLRLIVYICTSYYETRTWIYCTHTSTLQLNAWVIYSDSVYCGGRNDDLLLSSPRSPALSAVSMLCEMRVHTKYYIQYIVRTRA